MKRLALLLLCPLVFAQQPQNTPQELTIRAIFAEGGVTGRGPETVQWSPDGTRISYVLRDDAGERGELWYVEPGAQGKPSVLVAAEKLASLQPPIEQLKDERERERRQRYSVAGYHWAPDSKHLLFDSGGQLWLFSLATGTGVQVTSAPDPAGDPKFSPDGRHIAYLRKHNLYVRPVQGGEEKQLTTGKDANILNGEVDWVYAEELGVRSNYFWSPDNRQIVYLQMDESKVPVYPIEDFIPTHPSVDEQKYPKAGDPNPGVRLGVIGAGGGGTKWIALPEAPEYIPRFGWVRPGVIYALALNRDQNKLDLYFVDASSGRSRLILSESSNPWISVDREFSGDPNLLKSGGRFLWTSWRDGRTHIYLYEYDANNPLAAEAKLVRQLTRGDYDVFGIEAVEEKSGTVYYVSNQGNARQRRIYSVKLDGGEPAAVSAASGTHNPTFPDSGGPYYVDSHSDVATPTSLSVCRVGGACSPIWQPRTVDPFQLLRPQFLELKAADGATMLYASLLMPPADVLERQGGKAPLIMNPYGGPGAQTVRESWGGTNFLFDQVLARRGFAILRVDNRGMDGRGRDFQAYLFHNFGDTELKDQLAALDQVLQRFPQLDGSRVGFWGWSYGGYMTLIAMTHSDRFKAGVAVAPVTDYRNYDTIYTERFMGLPKDNAEGYRRSAPLNFASQLSGHVLIVHGTGDDNVHMQNTIQMVDRLIAAGKPFDLQLYPRKTHGIAGSAARTHLFTRIQQHFERELMGK